MSYEATRTFVELQSLAMTAPVLVLCAMVIYECITPLKTAVPRTQIRWILFGIILGFSGNLVDNFYWMIPWTSNYLQLPITSDLVNFGVFPNLVFRQGLTTVAAYCHIRAFISPDKPRLLLCTNIMVILSFLMGQIYIFFLHQLQQNLPG